MQFGILGPLRIVADDGSLVTINARKVRVLAASLLCRPGRVVSADGLIDALWANSPPTRAKDNLRVYVHHLRRALGENRVLRDANGIRLVVQPDELDAERFRRFTAEADRAVAAEDLPRAGTLFRAALALWRGPVFADLDDVGLIRGEAIRLEELRLTATESCVDVELALGRHAELCAELRALVHQHPLREKLCYQLMLALFRSDRQADALAAFDDTRRLLADELGLQPGARLAELHQRILRDDPLLYLQPATPAQPWEQPASQPSVAAAPSPTAVAASSAMTTPAQLPLEPFGFVGRERQIDQLDAILGGGSGRSAAAPIVVLSGAPGVGKTALAVRWAHRVAPRFPDGQLYVNLRGFDPDARVGPAEALQGFLIGLGVAAPRIPVGVASRAALFRSLVAGRRMLVVLDNASAADQVRPLLPGTAGCSVLVTSRNQLAGLTAVEGAVPVTLDVLTPAEARQMLASRLGSARAEAERSAVDEIIGRCARLPLAMAIAVARAAARPDFMLGVLARELRDGWRTFDVLGAGDPSTDVRTVFSWSYRLLSSEAARLYRLLGLHPGPDVSAPAAASMAGIAEGQARGLLTELTRANLLVERIPGRYAAHDLLRAWAGELCQRTDPQAQREAALHRSLDHYLHTARTAALLLQPRRRPITLAPATTGAVPEELTDLDQALAWFNAEHAVLMAVVRRAVDSGFDAHTWQLVWALGYYFHRLGHWHDWVSVSRIALAAAERLADPSAQAYARRGLARALTLLNSHEEAHRHLLHALALADAAGDRTGQAYTHHHLAEVCHRQGCYQEALDHTRQALELHRAADDQVGLGTALNNLGWYHTRLGEYHQAISSCRQALAVHRETGDRDAAAATWDSMGHAYQKLGQYRRAIACYRWAARLARKLGRRYSEATTLVRLGEAYHAAGWPEAACGSWRRALEILDDLAHPEADQLRARLESACQPTVAARQTDPDHPDRPAGGGVPL